MRSLLLLPLLLPLLATLLVAAINPRPQVSLRLLIWSSPALPLGVWMALAAGGGALLSGSAAALGLRQPGRSRHFDRGGRQVDGNGTWSRGNGAPPRPRSAPAEPPRPTAPTASAPPAPAAGPSRGPGEPAPTVAVPYRVIQRPPAAASQAAPSPPADDWDAVSDEDW